MKNKLLLCLLFFSPFAFGQLQNNIWYFGSTGNGVKFDFNTNIPTVINGSNTPLPTLLGCGVATNPTAGTVMFYTDGTTVFDVNNAIMPNGNGLNGGASCTQKGEIIPVPNNCNRFFVLSNNANSPASGSIYYSIVNMTLSGNGIVTNPKGDVENINKNIFIADTTTEALTVMPNSNGIDFWLLVPINNSQRIKVFSITNSGISYSSSFNTGIYFDNSIAIKGSAVAGKVAYTSPVENDSQIIMDFNSSTGILSNPLIIPGSHLGNNTTWYYGFHDVEFSPDGTKLYMSKYRMSNPVGGGRIYQYDLNFPSSPITQVFTNGSNDITKTCTGMKTGPDGKIYFIYFNTTTLDDRILGCINNPNLAGGACNVNPTAINLGVAQSGNCRLPDCIYYNESRPIAFNDSTTVTQNCTNLTVTATVNILNNDSNTNISSINYVTLLSIASHGSTQLLTNNNIFYSSNQNYIGTDTISYLLCDNSCYSVCDTGYVFITIQPCPGDGINENSFDNLFSISPNPTNGIINVSLNTVSEKAILSVTTILGEQIYYETIGTKNNAVIDLSKFSEGVYFITVETDKGRSTKKIVITK